jgi:predicted Zn-dependent protease
MTPKLINHIGGRTIPNESTPSRQRRQIFDFFSIKREEKNAFAWPGYISFFLVHLVVHADSHESAVPPPSMNREASVQAGP